MPESVEFLHLLSQELLDPSGKASLYRGAMDIASWLKSARAHAGKTLEQIGEIVGKTKSNVSAWENGRHEPSFSQLLLISRATNYPLLAHDISGMPPRFEKAGVPLSQWQSGLLEDMDDLLPEMREKIIADVHATAEQLRRHAVYLRDKTGSPSPVSDDHVGKHIRPAPKHEPPRRENLRQAPQQEEKKRGRQ